jgi:hypothetical protein
MRIHADPDPKPTLVRNGGAGMCWHQQGHMLKYTRFGICIGINTDPAHGSQINADPNLNEASLYSRLEVKVLNFSVIFS